jgi:hypothetical protein
MLYKKLAALVLSGIISCVLISAKSLSESSGLEYSGNAYDLKSGELYYTEEHQEIWEDDTHSATIILYKNPEGKTIAKKELDFKTGHLTPSFIQTDFRDGYMEGVEVSEHSVKVLYRKSSKHDLETVALEVPPPVVVDGGFNYFVKQNWPALLEGKTLPFNFVVPAEQDYYSFQLSKIKEVEYKGVRAAFFKMELKNFILRQLVPPIMLTYNVETKRLLKYEGISNINNAKGKSYFVKIIYPETGP